MVEKLCDSFTQMMNLPKSEVESIMKNHEVYCQDASYEDRTQLLGLEMTMASELFQSSSIEKKIWALGIINEKIKLSKMGMKEYPLDIEELLFWMEKHRIYEGIIQPNVHAEIINRSNQLLRFLYDHDKLTPSHLE